MSVVKDERSAFEEFVYDPFAEDVMRDPLHHYEVLREKYPAYYIAAYDTYFLSRFQDIYDALSLVDNSLLCSEGKRITPPTLATRNDGPVPDPPLEPLTSYTRYPSPLADQVRQAHVKPYQRSHVAKLEQFVREQARERLDAFEVGKPFDVIREFGGLIAASVTCHLFRLPLSEAGRVLDAVNGTSLTHEVGYFDVNTAYDMVADFVVPIVQARRAEGVDGSFPLIDGLLQLEIEGRGPLTDREISDQLHSVFIGGTETVPKVVGHGLLELWRRPEQLAEVRSDLEANCSIAYEEIVRLCAPAQWFARTVRKPVVLAGQEMKPGQRVVLIMGSANRDESEYEAPNEFRWNRPKGRSLTFGLGDQYCTGVHLARLEGRVLLEEFLGRAGDYEVDESNAIRHPSSFQWGYTSVPVTMR
jgi:cytochrome P450